MDGLLGMLILETFVSQVRATLKLGQLLRRVRL